MCAGIEIPEIECASPLGMENRTIPDSSIVASSSLNKNWGPERGRLNEKPEGKKKMSVTKLLEFQQRQN